MNYTLFTDRADAHGLDDARLHATLCNVPAELVNLWAFNWSLDTRGKQE